jgi:hypothetical protein
MNVTLSISLVHANGIFSAHLVLWIAFHLGFAIRGDRNEDERMDLIVTNQLDDTFSIFPVYGQEKFVVETSVSN